MSRIMFSAKCMQFSIVFSAGLCLLASLSNLKDCLAEITDESWAEIEKKVGLFPFYSEDGKIEIAMNWLQELRLSDNSNQGIVQALELLEELRKIVYTNNCGLEAKKLRKEVESQVKGKLVVDIVGFLISKNARKCLEKYEKYFDDLRNCYPDSVGLKRMRLFFFELFYHTILDTSISDYSILPPGMERNYEDWFAHQVSATSLYSLFIHKSNQLPDQAWNLIGYIALNTIHVLADRELYTELVQSNIKYHGGIVIHSEGAQELFSRLILDGCKAFVQFYGPYIFNFAQSDIEYIPPIAISEDKSVINGLFYIGWAQYKVCSRFINDGEERSRLLGLIGEIANSKASAHRRKLTSARN